MRGIECDYHLTIFPFLFFVLWPDGHSMLQFDVGDFFCMYATISLTIRSSSRMHMIVFSIRLFSCPSIGLFEDSANENYF